MTSLLLLMNKLDLYEPATNVRYWLKQTLAAEAQTNHDIVAKTRSGYSTFMMWSATATVSPCWLVTVIFAVARLRAGSVATIS